MQKIKAVFSSTTFWMVLVIAILVLTSLSIWLDFLKANKAIAPENIPAPAETGFQGPVGEPHIIGPSGPPPG